MQFTEHKFSKRFPPVKCAVFVIHEEARFKGNYRGTAAAIILPDGRFWKGVCLCAPGDQFIKKVGRAKAIGRAAANLFSDPNAGDYLGWQGTVTIIEAINDIPCKEPLIGSIEALKESLHYEIDEAKKRAGIY